MAAQQLSLGAAARVTFNTDRIIAHVDMDSFYAQVESRRLGLDESVPLAVQQWEGIIAVNYAARARGVAKRYASAADARKICPELVLARVEAVSNEGARVETLESSRKNTNLKVTLERYRVASAKIFEIFEQHVRQIERASIDEAYFDITQEVNELIASGEPFSMPSTTSVVGGIILDPSMPADKRLIAGAFIVDKVRSAVKDQLGYGSSAGIGHNKIIAKIGSSQHKPNQQTIVPELGVQMLIESLSLNKIRGLGGKLGYALMEMGCSTAGEAQKFSLEELQQHLGESGGALAYDLVRGISNDAVVLRTLPKSMMAEKNFGLISNFAELERCLKVLAVELMERLEHDPRRPKTFHVSFSRRVKPKEEGGRTMREGHSRSTPMPAVRSINSLVSTALTLLKRTDEASHKLFPIGNLGIGAMQFGEAVVAPKDSIAMFLKPKAKVEKRIVDVEEKEEGGGGGGGESDVDIEDEEEDDEDDDLVEDIDEVEIPTTSLISETKDEEDSKNEVERDGGGGGESSETMNIEEDSTTTTIAAAAAATTIEQFKCPKCGVLISKDEEQVHNDFHLAIDLRKEMRREQMEFMEQEAKKMKSGGSSSTSGSFKKKSSSKGGKNDSSQPSLGSFLLRK